jgi:methylated-DNA-[protein]-cysteine S-methyltransferase
MFYHPRLPLPLHVRFQAALGMIIKVELLWRDQEQLSWELEASESYSRLEHILWGWLDDYADGLPIPRAVPLLLQGLPPYSLKVLHELQRIPFGSCCSYKEIAHMTQNPHASRAVGSACRRNPLPLIIPCHRLLPSNGGIGQFSSGGKKVKEVLLSFEKRSPRPQ